MNFTLSSYYAFVVAEFGGCQNYLFSVSFFMNLVCMHVPLCVRERENEKKFVRRGNRKRYKWRSETRQVCLCTHFFFLCLGLDCVTYFPILTVTVGILVQLIVRCGGSR